MAMFYLVRHGKSQAPEGTLAGRTSGHGLAEAGRSQIEQLVPLLAPENVERIYASPLERTQESAGLLARALGLSVQTAEALNELDYGAWSGKAFADLNGQAEWALFNDLRSGTRMPQGELMLQTQSRAVSFMIDMRDRFPEDRVLLVTHGDVIRAALLYFLGMPLDFIQRIRVDVGSLSILRLDRQGVEVLAVNRLPQR